jgi:hypothetical protein
VKIISSYLNQTLILPLKIGVNEFYGALQATNIKAYRTAQMALLWIGLAFAATTSYAKPAHFKHASVSAKGVKMASRHAAHS